MQNKTKIVQVRKLVKRFGANEVLHGVSFDIDCGEVLAIIGPSGGGKSTLLRCVTNLERITSGTILIDGKTLVKDGIYGTAQNQREVCLSLGLVFQNFNLFPHFSVLRNVTEAQIHVLGRSRAEAESVAMDLLAKMGLASRAHAYPCELSGGQQQRVSIARSLALNPKILFFDEPTSALDPELTGEILKVIRQLADARMTMAIVTHEMTFARDVADRVLFLDGGVIAEEGPAADVIGNPRNARMQSFLKRYSESGAEWKRSQRTGGSV